MKLNEIIGKEKAKNANDLLDSIHNGIFIKDGRHLATVVDFLCSGKQLISLEGCPQEIGGEFVCSANNLISLRGGPKIVYGTCSVGANNLISLKGGPQKVGENFFCSNNRLTSLEGCPREIGANIRCCNNNITSFKDIHKHLKSMKGTINAASNPIKSHVLGLLKIEGCVGVILGNEKVQEIINKYLPLGDIFDCQEELIEAGFPEYAQL